MSLRSVPAGGVHLPAPSRVESDRGNRSTFTVLRLSLGVAWALNLVFILDPANAFFATFADTASGFGPTSVGGGGLARFVAGHSALFALLIAGTTAFLAVAFLTGRATRLGCVVGLSFNSVLLLTQLGSVAVMQGGTDIGPQPLYLAMYLALLVNARPECGAIGNPARFTARFRARTPCMETPGPPVAASRWAEARSS
ncbi:MAG: hypothetical protein L3K19_03750 [Thermoplasmata archaeon]|nr:hypothetical protein [Thermoplasmata archaeon]